MSVAGPLSSVVWDLSYPAVGQTVVLSPVDAQGNRAQTSYAFNQSQQITSVVYSGTAGGPALKRFDVAYDSTYGVQTSSGSAIGSLSSIKTTLNGTLVSRREFDYDLFEYPIYDPGLCGTVEAPGGCQDNINNGFPFSPPNTLFTTHGNVTAIREYDWGINAPGPLIRQTIRQYLHDQNAAYFSYPNPQPAATSAYWNRQQIIRNIENKVAVETIYDGSAVCHGTGAPDFSTETMGAVPVCAANRLAQTLYTYDNGAPQTYGYKGDLTSAQRLLSSPGSPDSWLTTSYGYDQYGNLTSVVDPKGHATTVSYNDGWAGTLPANCAPSTSNSSAYPTLITNALQQATRISYYPCTGLKQSVRDANDLASGRSGTQFGYDLMARLTATTLPDGGSTTIAYNDQAHTTNITKAAAPSPTIGTQTQQDLLGRTIQSSLITDPNGADITDTIYDGLGRVQCVSNPHRSASSSTDGQTCTAYDGLGRGNLITHPDGSQIHIAYSGNQVATTDETGQSTTQIADVLGHLTQVIEPGSLQTSYGYDALGNLKTVLQRGVSGETPRSRSFAYDSLSRLLWSNNPETGVICYGSANASGCQANGYDADGNLVAKTDARGQLINYSYDPLDRLTATSYSNGVALVAYGYDGNSYKGTPLSSLGFQSLSSVGRLSETTNVGNSAVIYSYDAAGRVASQQQYLQSSNDWSTKAIAKYDLAGNMTDLTYPDLRHIKQTWDSAGRLRTSDLVDIGGVSQSQSYVQAGSYLPDGSSNVVTLGNGIQETIAKNNRLQVQSMTVSTPFAPFSSSPFLSHVYCYVNCVGGAPTADNGDIGSITDALSGNRTQSFTYDALNRITGFSLGAALNQQYAIDSFGNLSGVVGGKATTSFNSSTNRASNLPCSASTPAYDGAGNQTCDSDSNGAVRVYSYNGVDQVSQIAMFGNIGNPFETYAYLGGDRIRKSSPPAATFTEYVGFAGQTIAEKDQTGGWTDYIYANGQKIARVEPFDVRAHLSGNRVDGSQTGVWGAFVLPLPQVPYLIKTGDKMSFRQFQHNAMGGLSIGFTDGSNSDWYCGADQLGECVKFENRSDVWVNRTIDLGGMAAGKTIKYVFLEDVQSSPQGLFDEEVADLTISSADGTVTQIIGRTATGSMQNNGNTCTQVYAPTSWPTTCALEQVTAKADPTMDPAGPVRFMLSDHLGSSQMEFTAGGWPVAASQFYPFGAEINPQPTTNHYKFTGKERDNESGLDYFGARYYASSMGRWMSPDWTAKAEPVPYAKLDNPQSLNLYSYVGNNPLSRRDPDGHYTCADGAKCDSANDKAFQGRLNNLKTAQGTFKQGSSQYNQIGKILSSYGGAGDTKTADGKTVSVGFSGGANTGGVTQAIGKGTIGVTLANNFSEQSSGNGNLSSTVLVGHEGQHVVDGAPSGTARLGSEMRAESVSQTILNGLDGTPVFPSNGDSFVIRGITTFQQGAPYSYDPGAAFRIAVEDYKQDVQNDLK